MLFFAGRFVQNPTRVVLYFSKYLNYKISEFEINIISFDCAVANSNIWIVDLHEFDYLDFNANLAKSGQMTGFKI